MRSTMQTLVLFRQDSFCLPAGHKLRGGLASVTQRFEELEKKIGDIAVCQGKQIDVRYPWI